MRSSSPISGRTLAAFALTLIATALGRWVSRADADSAPAVAEVGSAVPAVSLVPAPAVRPLAEEDDDELPAPSVVRKLDPNSQAFISRVDDEIPRKLYAMALSCGTGVGTHRDQKVKLGVELVAKDGEVSVREAKVLEATITDASLVECMRLAVRAARWRDDEMPDWADEDEIVVRLRGINKYTPDD